MPRLAVALLLAASATGRAAAEPACLPVARASGDPALVQRVVALLATRGVPVSGRGRCGDVGAVLVGEGAAVRVTLHVDGNRVVERVADDVEGAATLIESWARSDVSAPLLDARGPARRVQARRDEDVATRGGFAIAAAADAVATADGALWGGAHVQGCVRLGKVCAGMLLGYARDAEGSGDSATYATSRSSLDLLLVAELPMAAGRLRIAPGLAVGQTSVYLAREVPEKDRETVNGLRLRAHVAAGWPVAPAMALRVDLAVAYAPFADPLLVDPEGLVPPLAGGPRWQVSLGLGVAYGRP